MKSLEIKYQKVEMLSKSVALQAYLGWRRVEESDEREWLAASGYHTTLRNKAGPAMLYCATRDLVST